MSQLVLSLFPGIGLLDRAFEEEGFCVVRGPDVLWGGDIRRFHPPAGRFDGVIGGPPCQSFSSLVHLVRARGNEPRFGNLIPEFARVLLEATPAWFLMENVPAAPLPEVAHAYSIRPFLLRNEDLCAGDGFGQEQMRRRRFTFATLLPEPAPQQRLPQRLRRHTVVGGQSGITAESERLRSQRLRQNAVVGGHGKSLSATTGGGGFKRYSLEEACRLQGLPEDFTEHMPFTKDAKRDVIAAGVPLPMGRALARAVRQALSLPSFEGAP